MSLNSSTRRSTGSLDARQTFGGLNGASDSTRGDRNKESGVERASWDSLEPHWVAAIEAATD